MAKLTGMALLDAQDQLDDLMGQREGKTGLDLMDLLDQIDELMAQMGFDASASGQEEIPPEPEPQPDLPLNEQVPEIVSQFLAGEYNNTPSWQYLTILRNLEQYVPTFITMPQVIDLTEQWWDTTGQAEADVNAA